MTERSEGTTSPEGFLNYVATEEAVSNYYRNIKRAHN